jgi:outer membrane protein
MAAFRFPFCRCAVLAVALLGLLVSGRVAAAAERPKWELGIGSVFFTQPDYVGSDEYRFRVIPFPWIVYRGPRLSLDRDSLQTRIFGTDLVRLDLSASGQIAVDSDDNDRRHGMRDRDWLVQIGPTLKFKVFHSIDGGHVLDVDVPLRAAISMDFDDVDYQGLVSSPKLQYRYEPDSWRFEANAGLEFQNNDYNEFYYGVGSAFATAARPAYGAEGGYAGARLSAGGGRYFGPLFVGLFARWINLDGAAFEDSPLVGSRNTFIGGIAIGWVLMQSDELVPVGAEANLRARGHEPPPDSPPPAVPLPAAGAAPASAEPPIPPRPEASTPASPT